MNVAVIIILFFIAILVIVIVMGIIRVERKSDVIPARDEIQAPEPEPPEELVDLVDYYSDVDDGRKESTTETTKKEVAIGDDNSKFDKLCNFKVGRGYLLDCQNTLQQAQASGQKFALIYFDFNRFRFINSLKGYSTGDYALTRISQEAKLILPASAFTTRLSADHFVSLFPYVENTQIEDILDGLKRASEHIRSEIGVKSGLQICMGVVITDEPESYDIFKLMRRANIARHCIKASRSENYSTFDEAMLTSYLFGESALDDYNEHQYSDDYTLFLYPQLRLVTRRVTNCDSRVRWNYEQHSDSAISTWECGIIPTGNLKAAYHFCRAMSRWRKAGSTTIPATVILSEIDLFRENIDEFFVRCLSEFQLEASCLTVGVSLHSIRLQPEIVQSQMRKLKMLNVRIAVCDIERGIESLEILKDFPVDAVKLHRSFCHELERLPERQQQAREIIEQAKELGMDTVFDGVDSAACMTWLAEAGATLIQGRYVGTDLEPEDFVRELHGVLAPEHYDPSATVVLDDIALQKGEFHVF